MKKISLSLIAAALSFTAFSSMAMDARQPGTVVELFTSQGCSSCPPADALMGRVLADTDALGLSFAVTYWDYIGWKDTFGRSENDQRQVRYRDRMDARYVYTPQMVVAGEEHFVGSDSSQLFAGLEKFKGHAKKIDLKWKFENTVLHIDLPNFAEGATIVQLDIDELQEVKIKRGENSGRVLSYHNIVRGSKTLKNWDGKATQMSLDLSQLIADGRTTCVLLFEQPNQGPILAALQVNLRDE
jgi:hypothetical protein